MGFHCVLKLIKQLATEEEDFNALPRSGLGRELRIVQVDVHAPVCDHCAA